MKSIKKTFGETDMTTFSGYALCVLGCVWNVFVYTFAAALLTALAPFHFLEVGYRAYQWRKEVKRITRKAEEIAARIRQRQQGIR